jgi:hypothetical protein
MAGTDGRLVSLVTAGIDLTDRAPRREEDDRALEGDPEAKLAEVSRLATEQRALRRVATLVASEVSPERVFMAVSEECARVLGVNASAVLRYEGDETATIVRRHNRDNVDVFRVGESLPAEEPSAVARVVRTGAPARIDDWEVSQAPASAAWRRMSRCAAPIGSGPGASRSRSSRSWCCNWPSAAGCPSTPGFRRCCPRTSSAASDRGRHHGAHAARPSQLDPGMETPAIEGQIARDPAKVWKVSAFLDLAAAQPPVFVPGTGFC